jgi:hypothetical protein
LIARPLSTVTRIAQVSGQSCGQTARANSAGAFMFVSKGCADEGVDFITFWRSDLTHDRQK